MVKVKDWKEKICTDYGLCIFNDNCDYREVGKLLSRTNKETVKGVIKHNNFQDAHDVYLKLIGSKKWGKGVHKDKLVYLYGDDEGNRRWNAYRDKQSYSNTYEYKKNVHGMTQEEYKAYNKSRAITKENLIARHGHDKGSAKWENYVKRQAYTNSAEYLGVERYESINKKKMHNIHTFTDRYGDDGERKYIEYLERQSLRPFFSKKSQKLFDVLVETSGLFDGCDVYYATKNKEFVIYSKENDRPYFYDFVCPSMNLCIEFHGDHYHGNPKIYCPDDYLKGRGVNKMTAKEKWACDDIKNEAIIKRGYDLIIVWESDFDENENEVVGRIKEYVSKRNKPKRNKI